MTVTWQSVPTEELDRLASVLIEVAANTRGVLATGLQQEIEGVTNSLRYLVEQAESYTEAAAEQAKIDRNLASLASEVPS